MKKLRKAVLMLMAVLAVSLLAGGSVQAQQPADCLGCHGAIVANYTTGSHTGLLCDNCHEGAAGHLTDPTLTPTTGNLKLYPKVHFRSEICANCHRDQYNSSLTDQKGKTTYGGGVEPVTLWPKTLDLPYWNALIDGHGFVIETFEERNMMWNQIDTQHTRRPMTEACLTCHGTKVTYYMGLDAASGIDLSATPGAGKTRTIRNTQQIWSGNFADFQVPASPYITIPAGTTISYRINTNAAGTRQHQMESVVTLPDGRIFTSFSPYPGATATGDDPVSAAKRTLARNYVWAALQALSFDGLDTAYSAENEMYVGPDAASANAGVLCNMCHDPHTTKLRVIQKSSLWSIAKYGINPYSNTPIPPVLPGVPAEVGGPPVYDFNQATKQDQIIAVCGQCHSEYVGGYSAVDNVNRMYFPFAKINGTDPLNPPPGQTALTGLMDRYQELFAGNQDWLHGVGVRPWQSTDPGQRGYAPDDNGDGRPDLFPLNEPLIKTQHPEAESFWNSPMYVAGATCTDCHSYKIARGDGTSYTSHSFVSPNKLLIQGKNTGTNLCNRCHDPAAPTVGAPTFSTDELLDQTAIFMGDGFLQQESLQMFLMKALKVIRAKKINGDPTAAADVAVFRKAHNIWEYYANGENSMGFHNWDDLVADMDWALKNVGMILNPAATLGPVHSLMDEGAMAAAPLDNPPVPNNLIDLLWVATEPAAANIVWDANGKPVSWDYNGLAFQVWRQDCAPPGTTCGAWTKVATLSEPTTQLIDPTEPDAPPAVNWADDNNIQMGWTYNYKILTIKGAERSVFSLVQQVVANETALLPEGIQFATAGSEVRFHWLATAGDTWRFVIQRSTDPTFATGVTQLIAMPGDSYLTGWTDTTAPMNATLYYRIQADDGVAPSPWSQTFLVQTEGPPPTPGKLTGTVSADGTQVNLAWWDLSGTETGFRVERAENAGFTIGLTSFPLGPNIVAYTDAIVTPGATYYYRVVAFNDLGESLPTNSATMLLTPSLKILTPNGGETLASAANSLIRWQTLAGAASHILNYSTDNGATWKRITTVGTVSSYSWRVPNPGGPRTTCLVEVIARNAGGAIIARDRSDATFNIEPRVYVVTPNGGETLTSGSIYTLGWQSSIGAVRHSLYYSTNNGATWTVIATIGAKTSYNWTVPTVAAASPNCLIKVNAKDAAGALLASDRSDAAFAIQPAP